MTEFLWNAPIVFLFETFNTSFFARINKNGAYIILPLVEMLIMNAACPSEKEMAK